MFKIYATFLSMVFAATSAYGFSASQFLKVPKMSRAELYQTCSDFTGTWVGTCEDTYNDTTEESENTMVITQHQCDSITIDQDTMEFGVSKTITESDAESTTTIVVQPDWANSNSTIVATMSLSGKSLPQSQFQYSFTGLIKATFDLVDGQLVSKSAGKTSFKITDTGNVIDGVQASICTYEKQ